MMMACSSLDTRSQGGRHTQRERDSIRSLNDEALSFLSFPFTQERETQEKRKKKKEEEEENDFDFK